MPDGSLVREDFGAKLWRKAKQNPFVPLGFAAVGFTFTMAIVRQRQGRPRAMNNWLWGRVISQGFTIAAIGASFWMSGLREKARMQDAEAHERQVKKERLEFEERLRRAEEMHAAEAGLRGGLGSVSRWFVSGKDK